MFKWFQDFLASFKKAAPEPQVAETETKLLTKVGDVPVYWNGKKIWYLAGITIDADGSPRAYHPTNKGIDYLSSAGHPGNWWGIATDAKGNPYIQKSTDPYPGYYISTTSYFNSEFPPNDPRRYLDAEKVPFVVLPSHIKNMVAPKFLGCHCLVTNKSNGKSCHAVLADLGPKNHIGEGSIALARALDIASSPKTGGTNKQIIFYEIFPGKPAEIDGKKFKLL